MFRRIRLEPAVLKHAHLGIHRPGQPPAEVVAVEDGTAQALRARTNASAGSEKTTSGWAPPSRMPPTIVVSGTRDRNTAAASAVASAARLSRPRADQIVSRDASIGAVARKTSGVSRR